MAVTFGVVTVTVWSPVAAVAGTVAEILVAVALKPVASALPNFTEEASPRLVPEMVTAVPGSPCSGEMLVFVGSRSV